MDFSKFHKFVILNRNLVGKVAFFLYISFKKPVLNTYFENAPVHYNHVEVFFFSKKNTQNTLSTTCAKIEKIITDPIFQTATSSGLRKF